MIRALVQKNTSEEQNLWWVYIILTSDNNYYTGITVDVARRWNEHMNTSRGAKYFRGRRPQQLVYLEACENRSAASIREAAIKKFPRSNKIALLSEASNRLEQVIAAGLVLAAKE